ncbi:MAG: GerMN domain-containing protein, partial [Candidatus Firestonebacteria bacterium]
LVLALTAYMLFKNVLLKSGHSLIREKHSKIQMRIYCLDADGNTAYETREFSGGSTLLDDIKTAVEETGVRTSKGNVVNAVPAGVKVRNIFLDDKNCVYIDFDKTLVSSHAGGSKGELDTLNCIKNTLTYNFRDIEFVKLLVEGKELQTIAGHINTAGKLNLK